MLLAARGSNRADPAALDARLPFDEAYRTPSTTVRAISRTRATGGRVIALGTTVTRALGLTARCAARRRDALPNRDSGYSRF
ncbi:MAG: S-adenosylmethionine:tRNA ribosyltransferase-isomerase [Gemmatimonadetes bacterium]|nr:S-adenosylmethionine:tRNA ribosyltransferase-isomerase [Gemmatimonadota bacterium]